MEIFAIPSIALSFVAVGCAVQILQKLSRIERQLARLLPPFELSAEARLLADDTRRKIEAIKTVREETGMSLAEAKEAVETYIRRRMSETG